MHALANHWPGAWWQCSGGDGCTSARKWTYAWVSPQLSRLFIYSSIKMRSEVASRFSADQQGGAVSIARCLDARRCSNAIS